jgi:hypothetical protein
LWVRFRAIKQDPRQERPAARGSGDWACLGDVPDTKWSPIKWYVRLAQLHGVARDPRSPMFVDKSDVRRPLLYRVARQSFIDLQTAVGVAEGEHAGLHGLRVAGYNKVKTGLGGDMAQAHGGWASRAHERYARFSLADVVRIPAVIAGVDDGANAPPAPTNEAVEREAGPPGRRLQRGDLGDAGGVAPDAAPVAAAPAPADIGEEGGEGVVSADENESDDGEVAISYRRPPGPREGDSPEPLRYWFQAGYQASARPPPTPRPPPGASRASSPPSRRRVALPAQDGPLGASPESGSGSGD